MLNNAHTRRCLGAGLGACLTLAGTVHAETAEMLPAGIAKVRYQTTVGKIHDRFDSDGKRHSLNELYRAGLQASGLSTAVSSVYHIDTSAEVKFVRHDLYLQYGLTDNLGLGLWAHYVNQKADYSASLVQEAGWSSLSATQQTNLSGAVTAADGADAATAEFGDTVIGYKQRLVGTNGSPFRFAYLLGVRLPTGHVADPTDHHDLSTGDGQTDVGLWLSFDWVPRPNLLLNIHTRHEYQLADTRDALDPANTTNTLPQRFQPGFFNYLELKARYTIPHEKFSTNLELTAIYESQAKERAQAYNTVTGRYEGDLQAVGGSNTNSLVLEPQVGVDFFDSDIPLVLKLYYGIPLRGQNSLAPHYIGIRLDAYW